MAHYFEENFGSELINVKAVIRDILRFIETVAPKIDDADLYNLRLMFSELLCNAVIHGNNSDIQKKVHVSVVIDNNKVTAHIADQGLGFDYMSLLLLASDHNDWTSESGRGILLVSKLADSLVFNHSGNQIRFTKRI